MTFQTSGVVSQVISVVHHNVCVGIFNAEMLNFTGQGIFNFSATMPLTVSELEDERALVDTAPMMVGPRVSEKLWLGTIKTSRLTKGSRWGMGHLTGIFLFRKTTQKLGILSSKISLREHNFGNNAFCSINNIRRSFESGDRRRQSPSPFRKKASKSARISSSQKFAGECGLGNGVELP